ncbi:hypothetical protein [Rhodococcus sp. NPDC047139]|uniref:hypothetical protein n=1 Tax=Rhodococcus sp. NPDC047139 TaxID=3155141 RepID=UPI00340FD4B1
MTFTVHVTDTLGGCGTRSIPDLCRRTSVASLLVDSEHIPAGEVVETSKAGSSLDLPDLAPQILERIGASVASARSAGTRRTYASAWRKFTTWCRSEGHQVLPAHPVTVAAYLVAAADTLTPEGTRAYAPATLAHHLAAIAHHHREAGQSSPTGDDLVRRTMSGIRRDYATAGDRPRSPRAPLLTADVLTIVERARASCGSWADEVRPPGAGAPSGRREGRDGRCASGSSQGWQGCSLEETSDLNPPLDGHRRWRIFSPGSVPVQSLT